MRARSCFSEFSHPPSLRRDLEDGLVGRELVQDLLPKARLVALANALEVAERAIEAHSAVNHPGASLGEGHQVDFVVAAFAAPGARPARRPSLVADPTSAVELLFIDGGELRLNQGIEGDEELEQDLAVVIDPTLELEIRLADRHLDS